jgi:2-polyprenyl-3-methyl-5-hydroxy-6-metoxy-1,4-benzoquinol methylase
MSLDQQNQTRAFFDATSGEWQDKARGVARKVNIIRQRNDAVLRIAERRGEAGAAVDLGCGSGELAIELARRGWQVTGIDFAPEMIVRCRNSAREAGVEVDFRAMSMFDFAPPDGSFEIVSGQGLIEYISPQQVTALLQHAHRMLRPGGHLVLGSRNRLYNLVSLSAYTAMEQELNTIDILLQEALAMTGAADAEAAIAAARNAAGDPPHPRRHPHTAVAVETRYQYTPGQLVRLIERAGFRASSMVPVHFHSLPAPMAAALPQTHIAVSELMYAQHAEEPRLIPYASSFVLAAERI